MAFEFFWLTVLAAAIGSFVAGVVLLKIGIWLGLRVSIKIIEKKGYIYKDSVVHIKLTYKNVCQNKIVVVTPEAKLISGKRNNSDINLIFLRQKWPTVVSPDEVDRIDVEYRRREPEAIPRGYSEAVLTIKFGRLPRPKIIKVTLIRKEKREE